MMKIRRHVSARVRAAAACLGIAALLAGCGNSPSAPSVPQVSGAWLGEQTVTDAIGGDCLAAVFPDLIGFPSQFHATVTQTGERLSATLDIDHTGALCTYTGTLTGNTIDLTATNCTASKQLGFRCGNASTRDLLHVAGTLHGTITGAAITGTALETDSVVVSGTSESVAPLLFNSSFRLMRQ